MMKRIQQVIVIDQFVVVSSLLMNPLPESKITVSPEIQKKKQNRIALSFYFIVIFTRFEIFLDVLYPDETRYTIFSGDNGSCTIRKWSRFLYILFVLWFYDNFGFFSYFTRNSLNISCR